MNYIFKCKLCKNDKNLSERAKLLLWFDDIHECNICKNCAIKLVHVIKDSRLNPNKKQLLMDQWGLAL